MFAFIYMSIGIDRSSSSIRVVVIYYLSFIYLDKNQKQTYTYLRIVLHSLRAEVVDYNCLESMYIVQCSHVVHSFINLIKA